MKKGLKKIMSLMLAMMLVLGMTMTTFAAEGDNTTVTVTVPGEGTLVADHAFTAYQIFQGSQGEENVLGNIAWGDGINAVNFVKALKTSDKFGNSNLFGALSDNASAADVAKLLETMTDTDQLNAVAQIAFDNKTGNKTSLRSGTNTMPAGYYLIVDTYQPGDDEEDYVLNAALLQATKNVDITVKTDKPSAEKKVKENVKDISDNTKYGDGYNDVADYNIGDMVPFAFYSKVPDMSQYETYTYIFHDKMDAGLTLDKTTIVVKVGDTTLVKDTDYTVTTNIIDGCSFEIDFGNLKTTPGAVKGAEIRIDFTATLNENAKIGSDGNANEMQLEFSNNPNGDGIGKTPKDKVIVFTYELDVTKVDGREVEDEDGNKTKITLKDAEFKLQNGAGKWAIVDDTTGKLTGWADTEEAGSTLKSGDDGKFSVIGLDDGTYYLKETKAPGGYNILENPVAIKIVATTDNGQDVDITQALKDLNVEVDDSVVTDGGDADSGKVGVTVENNKGVELPETGGIGTTMFYILGGVLVLGCSVILITRKRMSRR